MTSNLVHGQFKQWGVGHGGFHTHSIRVGIRGELTIVIVFDCGSSSNRNALDDSVDTFVEDLPRGSTIDRLVVSHFDADHVSGLKVLSSLLKRRNIRVRLILAPFLSPMERLLLCVTSADSSSDYRNLVLDPERYLRTMFTTSVILVRARGGEDRFDEGVVRSGDADDDTSPPEGPIHVVDMQHGGLVVKTSGTDAGVSDGTELVLWEVLPFVQASIANAGTQFWQELVVLVPSLATITQLTPSDSIRILTTEMLAARAAVPSVRKTDVMNFSSITLYSGPGKRTPCSRATVISDSLFKGQGFGLLYNAAAAWLGTGDALYGVKRNISTLLDEIGRERAAHVGVIAAPHHGSRHNSRTAFWSRFPNAREVTLHSSGRYGLPHAEVLQDIYSAKLSAIAVDKPADSFGYAVFL